MSELHDDAHKIELEIIMDSDDPVLEEPEDEPAAFDDVAMILLMFFMVTSLTIYFPIEDQTEDPNHIPVVDPDSLVQNPPEGVTHRIFVESAYESFPDDQGKEELRPYVVVEWQKLGTGTQRNTQVLEETSGFFKPGTDFVAERSRFGEEVKRLAAAVEGGGDKPGEWPVDIVVFLGHEIEYATMQHIWKELNRLGKTDDEFQSKVARVAYRAEIHEP